MSEMILITGGRGQLGTEIRTICLTRNIPFLAPESADWDITDRAAGERYFQDYRPGILINCAAYTAVDLAEEKSVRAEAVNRDAVAVLCDLCKKYRCDLIQISTDYVFFGSNPNGPWRPDDKVSPRGVYARTKAEGEGAVLEFIRSESELRASIVRTSWVYSPTGHNFPLTILNKVRNGVQLLRVVEDQVGRPTSAASLAEFLIENLIPVMREKKNDPIYHYANSGVASWYDLTQAVLEMGREHGLVDREIELIPVPTWAYPVRAPRPVYSVLNLDQSRQLCRIPHWREELRKFFLHISKTGGLNSLP